MDMIINLLFSPPLNLLQVRKWLWKGVNDSNDDYI